MSKPSKQQIIELLENEYIQNGTVLSSQTGSGVSACNHAHAGTARIIADILVSAGLVEEPREPGWYWVRPNLLCRWMPAEYSDGWWKFDYPWVGDDPHEIGPRITPPEDA